MNEPPASLEWYRNTPLELAAQNQQHANIANQQWTAVQQAFHPLHQPPKSNPTITVSATDTKLRLQIAKLIDALPMSVCARILRVEFFPAFQEDPMRFAVTFVNQKTVSFYDIDVFPSDQHLAQIALDCP